MKNELYYIPANYTDAGSCSDYLKSGMPLKPYAGPSTHSGLRLLAAPCYYMEIIVTLFLMVPVVGFA